MCHDIELQKSHVEIFNDFEYFVTINLKCKAHLTDISVFDNFIHLS